jgi:hypothetical protein
MGDELDRVPQDQELEHVSMDEIEAEGATALPNQEVMSLLNVDANVDLGLDLAAPVDLAVAANLNSGRADRGGRQREHPQRQRPGRRHRPAEWHDRPGHQR